MTNGGLSMNTEVFMMPPSDPNQEPIYLVQLNCAWAWPPLKAARSPLVLFLRDADSATNDPGRIPLFFRKVKFSTQTWRAVDSGQWCSLGRRDILIEERASPRTDVWGGTGSVAFDFKPLLSSPANHSYYLARIDSRTGLWNVHAPTDAPPVILERNEACIYRGELRGGIAVKRTGNRYLVVIKWNRWNRESLSCGVWFRSPTDKDALESLLDGDRDGPYPNTAPYLPEFGFSNTVVLKMSVNRHRFWSEERVFLIQLLHTDDEIPGALENILPIVRVKPSRSRERRSSIETDAEPDTEGPREDFPEDSSVHVEFGSKAASV
jgi:hypothetical protein